MLEFLKKIFREEKVGQEKKLMGIEEAKKDLEGLMSNKFAEIERCLERLRSIGENLKNKKIDVEEGDFRLRKVSNTALQQLGSRLVNISKLLEVPKGFEERINYCFNAKRKFEIELAKFWKSIVISRILAKEELKETRALVETLVEKFEELKNIKNHKYFELRRREVEAKKEKERVEKIKTLREDIEDLEKKLVVDKGKVEELEKEIEECYEGAEFRNYKNAKRVLDVAAEEFERFKMSIINEFLSVRKVLQKIKFLLSKEELKILDLYLTDFSSAIEKDIGFVKLKKFFSIAKESLEKSKIDVKNKEKFLIKLEGLAKKNLEEVYRKFEELKKNIEKNRKNIDNSIIKKIKGLEKRKEELERVIGEMEERKKELVEKLKSLTTQV